MARERLGVVGAGRQGTATAYDLARFGGGREIWIADQDRHLAEQSARRINRLLGRRAVIPHQLDVRHEESLHRFLCELKVCASAVPYHFNLDMARRAIAAGCSMCDLGGNTPIVLEQLKLDGAARSAGVSLVPDCGVGPGMISNLALYAAELMHEPEEILIYDGGLPQNPRPPFRYLCFFNIEGLTNEYAGNALYLVDGEIQQVECFLKSEYEQLEIPQLGRLEAFTTAGGLTTLVSTLQGKVRTLKNKTLRYPGHFALFTNLKDLGFLEETPIQVDGQSVSARRVLNEVLKERFQPKPADRDLMVIHIRVLGKHNAKGASFSVDMLDRYDEATGFSAMQRTTGFQMAIVAHLLAAGEVGPGAVANELAVHPSRMVEELRRREMEVTVTWN